MTGGERKRGGGRGDRKRNQLLSLRRRKILSQKRERRWRASRKRPKDVGNDLSIDATNGNQGVLLAEKGPTVCGKKKLRTEVRGS